MDKKKTPLKYLAVMKRYRIANAPRIKQLRELNKEANKAYQKAYREANKEKMKEYRIKYKQL